MTARQRRARLATADNPDARHDYMVTLDGSAGPGLRLELRYVPDRWVLARDGVAAYLDALAEEAWEPEALALAVLDDVNNEVVPRWIEVRVSRDGAPGHRVVVEDRQPGWDNPLLMGRLGPL